MKNLNSYGEKFINEVIEKGRLEDGQLYKQIDYISITESNTHFLINIEVVEHSESKYIYNNIKYIYHRYKKFICNEIFTISKRLDEYYSSNDLSRLEIKQKLENKILYRG